MSKRLSAEPRIFSPTPLRGRGRVALSETAAIHVARVLRMAEGDTIVLFDGAGGEHAARLCAIRKDRVEAEVVEFRAVEREAGLSIRLVQCVQGGDKMDLTIQKAVELGVAEIVPILSRRSVVRLADERARKRVAHWRQIVVAACEQCGRNRLPAVAELSDFEHWLAGPATDKRPRLLLSPTAADTLATVGGPAPDKIELLIGPEGGLTPEENALATTAGFHAIRLGPRVLRTETAGLAAIAAMHARWGDFL